MSLVNPCVLPVLSLRSTASIGIDSLILVFFFPVLGPRSRETVKIGSERHPRGQATSPQFVLGKTSI